MATAKPAVSSWAEWGTPLAMCCPANIGSLREERVQPTLVDLLEALQANGPFGLLVLCGCRLMRLPCTLQTNSTGFYSLPTAYDMQQNMPCTGT